MKNEKNFDKDKKRPQERVKTVSGDLNEVNPSEGSKTNVNVTDNCQLIKTDQAKEIVIPADEDKPCHHDHLFNAMAPNSKEIETMNKTTGKSTEKDSTTIIQKGPIILPDSEIIPNCEKAFLVKRQNPTFSQSYLISKLTEMQSNVNGDIIKGVMTGFEMINKSIQEGLIDNRIYFSDESKSIDEIISQYEIKKSKIEEAIRIQKIKDLHENQESIKNKIFQLNENMKVLENDGFLNLSKIDLNSSSHVVDDNIRRSQIKEIRQTKEILVHRLKAINSQVQKLMTDEEQIAISKKFNLKQFLDNFEKDKEIAEMRAFKYEEQMKQREQKMRVDYDRTIDRRSKEIDQKEKEDEIKRKKQLEHTRQRELENVQKRVKDNLGKLDLIRVHMKDKPANENEYLFKVIENEYNIQKENKIKEELMKRKAKIREKIITKEEIDEFARHQKDEELRREAEKEEEKNKLKEMWKATSENLPKFQSQAIQRLKEEEKKEKEAKEYEDLKKKIKQKEIKNYSEAVVKLYLPKIDENNKKEIEERIKRLQSKPKISKHHRKHLRILLKKPNPNNPKKYKWDLKFHTSSDKKTSKSFLEEEKEKADTTNEGKHRSISEERRLPKEKLPDYLKEMRIKKARKEILARGSSKNEREKSEKKWEKMINNEKNSLLENVEQIKIRAQVLEEQAKMKEKFLLLSGGTEMNPELGENVSNMLLDAIQAKLTILESISKKKS